MKANVNVHFREYLFLKDLENLNQTSQRIFFRHLQWKILQQTDTEKNLTN